MQPRYVVVTGGVLSGLGKGTTTSSLGALLKARGVRVTAVKIDPYVNVDAGTMNPFEHGEVFVLEDGGEVDLDLGNYERFLDVNLTRENNITTGKIFSHVIEKERAGSYLGKTVQIVPHVTQEILESIQETARKSGAHVVLIEVGGTVGDIESMPFLEAIRQLRRIVGEENFVLVHTTLVPILSAVGEFKTKPTQHSVRELKSAGLDADVIVCRCERPLDDAARRKIALMCDVAPEAVVSAHDVPTKYAVPLLLHEQGLDAWLAKRLNLQTREPDLAGWRRMVERIQHPARLVEVAIVGKYTHLHDSYMSIVESFTHAGAQLDTGVRIRWVESTDLEREGTARLEGVNGVLVPGGFGIRGTGGKMLAIQYARERGIPYLGLCFGFQLAVIEFCRNVLGLKDADSTELAEESGVPTQNPVIDLLPEQRRVRDKGGTMRLGAQPVQVAEGTKAHALYASRVVLERHRHRYEVNPQFIPAIEEAGLQFAGRDPTGMRMEIAELRDHPFFLGSQFHPEFRSRPGTPAPLFLGLVAAMAAHAGARSA